MLSTRADICVFGGSGGGGKSYSLLLEPLRHIQHPRFNAVIFRRTTKQVRNAGGLWDEASSLYSQLGAKLNISTLECIFKSGMKIQFAHLEHEKNVYDWQGAQVPLICFDELTHFTENQFWYMLSRNRSASGVSGYVRATCNPDADSWVARLIAWWIGDDGYPIPDRAGVLRWFVRINDELHFADYPEDLIEKFGSESLPKSLTFIPAKLEDNPILMQKDPGYAANLEALPFVERMRLKNGNWKIRAEAGTYFKREWFKIIDNPVRSKRSVRYWDRASTEVSSKNPNPDATAGLRLDELEDGTFCVMDIAHVQMTPAGVQKTLKNTASQDGLATTIALEQDPGQAGKVDVELLSRLLAGYEVKVVPARQDKGTRARGASAGIERQIIVLKRGSWNEAFIQECVAFSGGDQKARDDRVDALSGAYNFLTLGMTGTFTESMTDQDTTPIVNDQEW